MPRYIAFGGTAIDYIVLPDGREMPPQFGGNAIYAAVGMKIWSSDVGIVSLMNKNFPEEWIDELAASGIDTSGIRRSKSSMGIKMKMQYHEDGTRTPSAAGGIMVLMQRYFPQVLAKLSISIWRSFCPQVEDIPEAYFQAVGAHICAIEYQTQARALEALHGKMKWITFDPAPTLPGQPQGTIPQGLGCGKHWTAVSRGGLNR